MKLSEFILDIGRVVAYYPKLKLVTRSTTATILLCQFLYWSDKTKDNEGWIYKTSDEIEEETGLTYYEQKTAKLALVEMGLLENEFKRLDHTSRFRVNKEMLNTRWEESHDGGVRDKAIIEEFSRPQVPQATRAESTVLKTLETGEKKTLLDGAVEAISSPAMEKMRIKDGIKTKLEKSFHINADGRKWEDFIDFLYKRQEFHDEPADVFMRWSLRQKEFNPVYWTPEKMRTLHPGAYVEPESGVEREDFVEKLPEQKEEEYAPMPKELGLKRDLT